MCVSAGTLKGQGPAWYSVLGGGRAKGVVQETYFCSMVSRRGWEAGKWSGGVRGQKPAEVVPATSKRSRFTRGREGKLISSTNFADKTNQRIDEKLLSQQRVLQHSMLSGLYDAAPLTNTPCHSTCGKISKLEVPLPEKARS